jgi:hypothetical protein
MSRALCLLLAITAGLPAPAPQALAAPGSPAVTSSPTLVAQPANAQARDVALQGTLLLLSVFLGGLTRRAQPPTSEQKVYFCRTCVIYAYKPGPCVCCGMEVELLVDPATDNK